ncbi:hypothetical protein AGABI1DRAFT_111083 [Agaricus bisporus var. burnettii JB137-S8]|uniref:Uncharacterized protein n=2 Tax=Agaricus bisporus var. burnettii TaxID=192524 RepID=K5XGQ9_AGABU|nr:uncharacterized protein AGABI1DRAFT_111083 [Agaricus bisporus var. burnettii JB137-S8]EKM82467.1 hypothetical protein AGABI1DRAFT_111083 [Agaricus bisporus var. burnettii JB137-S8]KAF7778534.1 hypothetical protein Agabi119p4_2879 [Agaricus bisporus var. burnettii]
MPSLRRTASSPAVRPSPYLPTAARVRHKKRSPASLSSARRVLADIDWWRVTEGQSDPNHDDADENRGQGLIVDIPLSTDVSVGHPPILAPLHWDLDVPEHSLEVLPTAEFAALSISPSTPTRRGCDSSSSSVESSPEQLPENLFDDVLSELDMGFLDSPLPPLKRVPRSACPRSLVRSFTFADTHSLRVESPSHYADFTISPLSSAPDFLN